MWAPTAQRLDLLHWPEARGGQPEVVAMTRGSKGEWTVPRPDAWQGHYYKIRARVYCHTTQLMEVGV